jgi:SAM-dependent methyltransferase
MTFKRTDYQPIARRYDEFREKWNIPADDALDAAVVSIEWPRVLDLACGTGTYIVAQAKRHHAISWIGVDASSAMLQGARQKGTPASFARARAESLPFRSATFDYAFSSYAFHHFADKEAALDEVTRVIKPGARFRIVNVEPWSMPTHWVYRFFDGTREADHARFWPVSRIATALDERGFAVDVDIETSDDPHRAADLLAESESRTISQLAIVDDASYELGLKRLRAIVAGDANVLVESVSATVRITATLR